jgi:hypothetical protein
MSTFAAHKVVSALPATLVANAIYAVRVGEGFDLYITDTTGQVAHKVNGKLTWTQLAIERSADPTDAGRATEPVPGDVLAITLGGVTRYRLVPDSGLTTDDAFYSNFAAGVCSGLIVSRG